jgi:hypothetical protein
VGSWRKEGRSMPMEGQEILVKLLDDKIHHIKYLEPYVINVSGIEVKTSRWVAEVIDDQTSYPKGTRILIDPTYL